MESDKKNKPKGLHKVNDLEELPQEYEGYHTYVKKQNIVHEKTKTVKTSRIPNHLEYEKNNLQHSHIPNINNEYSDKFPRSNRKMENDPSTSGKRNFIEDQYSQDSKNYNKHKKSRHQSNLSGHSPTHSNRVSRKSANNSARYIMSDENYTDNSRSINNNRRKMDKQANFELLPPDNLTRQNNKDIGNSLICEAINSPGECIIVNNKVIRDVILRCKPRNISHTPEVFIGNKHSVEEQVTNYGPSDNFGSTKSPRGTLILHQNEKSENHDYSFDSANQDKYDLKKESLGSEEIYNQNQLKDIDCKHLLTKCKNCIWILFVVSTLLTVIGLILACIAVYYHLFRYYLSIVIGETGFVTWMWVVFFTALLIITIGVVGIFTSMINTKPMLKMYLVLAIILLAILILTAIIFLVQYSALKKLAMSETDRTFLLYRCVRRIRNAWDDMMEIYHCCGKDKSKDWKYIPPACCNATSKPGKLACIGHFIQPSQAFDGGCKPFILSYYLFLHTEILILLLMGIILLIIGIFIGVRLHHLYEKVKLCKLYYFPL